MCGGEQYKFPAFMDTKRVIGKINYKGVNRHNQYTTVNCDPSYKENRKGHYDREQQEEMI